MSIIAAKVFRKRASQNACPARSLNSFWRCISTFWTWFPAKMLHIPDTENAIAASPSPSGRRYQERAIWLKKATTLVRIENVTVQAAPPAACAPSVWLRRLCTAVVELPAESPLISLNSGKANVKGRVHDRSAYRTEKEAPQRLQSEPVFPERTVFQFGGVSVFPSTNLNRELHFSDHIWEAQCSMLAAHSSYLIARSS